ncbi:helix-turn-helix domain-containing protein [Paeniglutamicibacter sp.]|uniref:helix-turn-helix domain-containing protein n=1 Tax=Paeniglutamicibacter sp. TaxID=1934391 RepID=UPI003989004F
MIDDRIEIQILYEQGTSKAQIARRIGVHRATIAERDLSVRRCCKPPGKGSAYGRQCRHPATKEHRHSSAKATRHTR